MTCLLTYLLTSLDPFQFNLIVQLPGQTVAAHLDGVYFWGATRFQLPQVSK